MSNVGPCCRYSINECKGRLSRTMWSKIASEDLPSSFRRLTIGIADTGPTHSWSLDHLQSLTSFPFSKISELSIIRTSCSPFIFDGTESPEATVAPLSVPNELVKHLQMEGKGLMRIDCDWWSWSPEDVKNLLESCPRLQV